MIAFFMPDLLSKSFQPFNSFKAEAVITGLYMITASVIKELIGLANCKIELGLVNWTC